MSTVTSVVNHFPTANEGFVTTLGSSILAGATTVPLTSVSGLSNGTIFIGIIEPGLANEQTFTGTVDTAGVQITGVKWTKNTNVDHTAGVTIVDYVTGTGQNMMTKGILVNHAQGGTHKTLTDANGNEWLELGTTASAVNQLKATNAATGTGPTLSASGDDTNIDLNLTPKGSGQLVVNGRYDGWSVGALPAVSSVTANGNRSYDITFASTVASTLSSGMRLRTTRTVAAPTYMGGLMNGSTHYFTKVTPTSTLSTVANNFTLHATIQPTAYAAGYIGARGDAAGNNALGLYMEADGRITVIVRNGAAANFRYNSTYQSVPLNKKTTVTATWAGGTAYLIYFDGVSVPMAATASGGTNPTTAGTGGDFSIGRPGAQNTLYFTGYVSGFAVFDAVLSASTIKAMQGQALTGSETNCIGAWSLNNTAVNQQAPGTNDLTATGGVGYTNKSPYGNDGVSSTLDYALVMAVSGSTATVQVPEGCTIPTSGGVTSVAYSVQGNPYGWVSDKGRWAVQSMMRSTVAQNTPAHSTYYNIGSSQLQIPTGTWSLACKSTDIVQHAGATYLSIAHTVSTSSSAESDSNATSTTSGTSASSAQANYVFTTSIDFVSLSSPTAYYVLTGQTNGASSAGTALTSKSTLTALPTNL